MSWLMSSPHLAGARLYTMPIGGLRLALPVCVVCLTP